MSCVEWDKLMSVNYYANACMDKSVWHHVWTGISSQSLIIMLMYA